MKWFLNTFSYWTELYSEIRIWWIFRSTCRQKDNLQELNNEDLRVDWLGRAYGIINMPEEVQGAAPQIQQAYVMQQLANWNPIMQKLGLADIVYPEMSRVPGTVSYLVILWPQYESLTFLSIIGNLIRTAVVSFGLFLIARLIYVNAASIAHWFTDLLQITG